MPRYSEFIAYFGGAVNEKQLEANFFLRGAGPRRRIQLAPRDRERVRVGIA